MLDTLIIDNDKFSGVKWRGTQSESNKELVFEARRLLLMCLALAREAFGSNF